MPEHWGSMKEEIVDSRILIRKGVPFGGEKRLLWQESERCCSPGESHYVPRGGGALVIKMRMTMAIVIITLGRFRF